MKRKANQVKLEKINQEIMPKKDLEQYFTAIKQRFDDVDKRFDDVDKRFEAMNKRFDKQDKLIQQRFDLQDKKLQSILDVVKFYDTERKDIKSTLWEHNTRLTKLEKQLA